MRIIAGEFSSRKLETLPGEKTRPTLDKVKEAVFSSLGGFFDGGECLDLYAGSGAIGLEALSRGMDHCVFGDRNPKAVAIIKKNIASLGVEERCEVYCMKDFQLLEKLKEDQKVFSLVYLDPPYEKERNEEVLTFLSQNHLLEKNARIIIEARKEDMFPDSIGTIKKTKEATYGITKIHYYQEGI
ncbi:MAG: 16S rRNA (guanine(966)-N(2))-methyltransferase RsmD [Solobacterium sp.]|nr:16S rRNA (guanine(966)-N(2))-methyltransferase RsmD [Solobacterium sp.]